MTQQHDSREAGFTLLEMLVALAIFGMLATLLLGGLKGASLSQRGLTRGQAAADEVIEAQERLRATVERLWPEKQLLSASSAVDVRGTAHDLAFFGPPPAAHGRDQLQRYRLLLTATGDLVLYMANGLDDRIDLNAPGFVGWQPLPLLRGVTQLTLTYFGTDPLAPGRDWQTRWYDRQQPPELIRVRVDFPPGDARHWPDLLLRPQAMGAAPCLAGSQNDRCGTR